MQQVEPMVMSYRATEKKLKGTALCAKCKDPNQIHSTPFYMNC